MIYAVDRVEIKNLENKVVGIEILKFNFPYYIKI